MQGPGHQSDRTEHSLRKAAALEPKQISPSSPAPKVESRVLYNPGKCPAPILPALSGNLLLVPVSTKVTNTPEACGLQSHPRTSASAPHSNIGSSAVAFWHSDSIHVCSVSAGTAELPTEYIRSRGSGFSGWLTGRGI